KKTTATPLNVAMYKKEISSELNLAIHKEVSSGGFSRCFQAKDLQTKSRVAAKVMTSLFDDSEYRNILVQRTKREIHFLSSLQHENVVRFYGHLWIDADGSCWIDDDDEAQGN